MPTLGIVVVVVVVLCQVLTATYGLRTTQYVTGLNASTYRTVGEPCDAGDSAWYGLEDEPRKFLYCDTKSKRLTADWCAVVNNVSKIFDGRFQQCVMPALGKHRSPGTPKSSAFGEPCLQNIDCLNNMYCPTGQCLCVSGYIDLNTVCVPAIPPGQTGCSSDRECRAYWPMTSCISNKCTCILPPNIKKPDKYEAKEATTSEGIVCQIYAKATGGDKSFCPLPIPIGALLVDDPSALAAPWTDGGPAAFKGTTGMPTCTDLTTPCSVSVGGASTDYSDMAMCVEINPAGSPRFTCCPNRAHACMQPIPDNPQTANSETRYAFNQATGTCQTFYWDGNKPIANNFKTIEHCLSYCGGICRRGYSKIDNGALPACSASSCQANQEQCIMIPSAGRQACCPTTLAVCNSNVRTADSVINGLPVQYDGATSSIFKRWRYNTAAKECVQFEYTGWGGNYNNFATRQDCLDYCQASVCEQGEPLKTVVGTNQQCSNSLGCPSAYECRSSICCPKKRTVCIQPRRQGSCSQSISRYWYNAATRDCEQFSFTGCGGNDNNFDSYQACVTFCREVKPEPQCIQGEADKDSSGNFFTCSISGAVSSCRGNYECYFDGFTFGCCPQRAYTCSLPRQIGSRCVTPTTRWYYDTTSRTCQTFTYNGCDGNSNNFINRQECERYCGVGGCPFGGEPFREPSSQIRICNAQTTTCGNGYACNTVAVSGSSVNYCCQTRAFICQQSPIQGTQCASQLQRYYFNMATRQCSTFTYFGCGGNDNNFATLSQCQNFCGSAACLAGEAAYVDPNNNRPLTCNPTAPNNCPTGYYCRSDSLTNTNVCCGSNDMGVCPTGEKAYVDALSLSVRECQPSVAASCPNNYLCRPNSSRGRYYCCAGTSLNICPAGKAVYRNPGTNQPMACFVSTINQCPQDYSCQPITPGQSQGFCCTINVLCPNNGEFFVDQATQEARRCTVQTGTFNQCPNSYTCMASNPSTPTNGYCCRGSTTTLCTVGQPLLENGVTRQCLPNQAPFCPSNYACTPATGSANLYYCCTTSISGDGCPSGSTGFMQPGLNSVQLCNGPSDVSCPMSYTCQLSTSLNRYQCCSGGNVGGDGCPPGMIAFRENGGSYRTCNFGGNECPSPYSCQASTSTGRPQCCGLTAGCPTPNVAAISSSTGQPLLCSGTGCPVNYQCMSTNNGQMTCCGIPNPIINPVTPQPTNARCPFAGQQPYLLPGSLTPQTCRVGVNTCPRGYSCLNGGGGFICCSSSSGPGPNPTPGTSAGYCPAGSTVYNNPVTQRPQTCAGSFVRCPATHRCQYSNSLRNYYCCSIIRSEPSSGVTQCWGSCNPGGSSNCQRGYSCQSINGRYQCCRGASITNNPQPIVSTNTGTCPSGNPLTYPGTQSPLICQTNNTPGGTCPTGYRCTRTSNRNVCCPTMG